MARNRAITPVLAYPETVPVAKPARAICPNLNSIARGMFRPILGLVNPLALVGVLGEGY